MSMGKKTVRPLREGWAVEEESEVARDETAGLVFFRSLQRGGGVMQLFIVFLQ